MHKYIEINQMKETDKVIHESAFRAHHILNKVIWLLEKNTPPEVILELIDLMTYPIHLYKIDNKEEG